MSTFEIPIMSIDSSSGSISFPLDYITVVEEKGKDPLLVLREDSGTLHKFPLSTQNFVTFKIVVRTDAPKTVHYMQLQTRSLSSYSVTMAYDRSRYNRTTLEPKYLNKFGALGLSVIGSDDVRIGYVAFTPITRPGDSIGFKLSAVESANWLEIACQLPTS